jgi:phosphatidylserine decarboxylase
MPRPHLSQHLSLNRFKSSTGSANSTAPSTPLVQSRSHSPAKNGSMKAPTSAPDGTTNAPQMGDHKGMGLVLKVEVLRGRNLAAKDKSGTSDPFLVLTLGDAKEATSVISRTLNPEWNQTFELPILTADSALLEAVCWDKDRFRNDYMGEFDVVLEDLFASGSTSTEAKWFPVKAKRSGRRKSKKDSNISGEILIKFTLQDPLNTAATPSQTLQRFYGVVADGDDDEEDDGDILARIRTGDLDDLSEEDDEDKDPSDETDEGPSTPSGDGEEKQRRRRRAKIKKLKRKTKLKAYEFSNTSDVAGVLFLEINRITDLPPEKNVTRTSFDMDPFVVASLGRKTYRTKVIKHELNPVYNEKLVFQVIKQAVNYSLNFAVVDRDKFSGNDFVGTASFPLSKVTSLQPDADPETGLYALPELDSLQAGGDNEIERKKRFRNPLSRTTSRDTLGRSSRNSSSTNLQKPHRSSSSNSLSSQARPNLVDRRSSGPTSNPHNRSLPDINDSQALTDDNDPGLTSFVVPLELKNKSRWEDKHNPVLYIQAKYLSYQAIRQQFWRAMLRQYDVDDSGSLSKVELTTMLDTLGSTLHNSTIDGFFNRFKGQNAEEGTLTMDQAVICLEEQLRKSQDTQKTMHMPHWKKSKVEQVKTNDSSPDQSPGGNTPAVSNANDSNFDPNKVNVPALKISDMGEAGERGDYVPDDDLNTTESDMENDLNDDEGTREEHVVEIQECPICHQPRLARGSKNTDADIITHIATCASSDWKAVNNLVMAGFVTSSQAQRKWYSKVISKVSENFKIGITSSGSSTNLICRFLTVATSSAPTVPTSWFRIVLRA